MRRVALGEEITIAKAGVPVAKLIPIESPVQERKLGIDAGKIWIADDFDAPLPDEAPKETRKDSPQNKKGQKR